MEGLIGLARKRPNTVLRSAAKAHNRGVLVQELDGANDDASTVAEVEESFKEEHHTPSPSSSVVGQRCMICRLRSSPYTCSQCNVPYCSLACFRAPKHAKCAESFQRQAVHDEAGESNDGAPKAGEEERKAMMDVLLRMKSLGTSDDDVEGESDRDEWEDEESILTNKAERVGLDLDHATAEELLALLSKEERVDFEKLLDGRKSTRHGQDLKRLVGSVQSSRPWWNEEDSVKKDKVRPDLSFTEAVDKIAGSMRLNSNASASLRWNVITVLLSYVYVIRHFDLSSFQSLRNEQTRTHDVVRKSVRQTLRQLVPFLVSNRQSASTHDDDDDEAESRRVLHDVEEVTLWIVARLESNVGDSPARTMKFLLDDTLALLRRPKVQENVSCDDGDKVHSALGDVHTLLSKSDQRKVVYYAAQWKTTIAEDENEFVQVRDAMQRELDRLQSEIDRSEDEERWRAAHEAVERSGGVVLPPPS